ncbi:hypothetical protein Tco_0945864 [Tanacetum coccineum]
MFFSSTRGFGRQLQLPYCGVILAIGLAMICTLPVGVIVATTYQGVGLNGLVGPQCMFGNLGLYSKMNYFFLFGILAPVPFWYLSRKFPEWNWPRLVNIPILINCPGPPVKAVNYNMWFTIGMFFKFVVYKRFKSWNINGPEWWGLEVDDHCPLANCPSVPGTFICKKSEDTVSFHLSGPELESFEGSNEVNQNGEALVLEIPLTEDVSSGSDCFESVSSQTSWTKGPSPFSAAIVRDLLRIKLDNLFFQLQLLIDVRYERIAVLNALGAYYSYLGKIETKQRA